MNPAARGFLGFLAGALLCGGALAAVARARGAGGEPGAGEEEPRVEAADAGDEDALRSAIAAAEAALAGAPEPPAVAADRAAAAAGEYGRALKDGLGTPAPTAAARRVTHLLDRARFEHLLSDEEMLCHPARDRMLAAFLEGAGAPLSPEQAARLEELLQFEEASWRDRLSARRRETLLERAAASLELASREEDWLNSILSLEQQQALAAETQGRSPEDSLIVIGRRRGSDGERADAGPNGARRLATEWARDFFGDAGRLEEVLPFAEDYLDQLRSLGAAREDATGRLPLAWRRRQARLQADLQKKLLAHEGWDEEERKAMARWREPYVLVE